MVIISASYIHLLSGVGSQAGMVREHHGKGNQLPAQGDCTYQIIFKKGTKKWKT